METKNRLTFIDRVNELSYSVIFLFWVSSVLIYAAIYIALSYVPGNGPSGLSELPFLGRMLNSLYYSVITATNTGYGDIVPLGYSRFFAALQSVTELFLFALFIAKLVSYRQDKSIKEVHQLSFELTFRSIREDFYVARKDFDHVIQLVENNNALTDAEWERLTIAYQQISSLLKEIPNFYDVISDLYVIDPGREVLLLDAVQRTTARINRMLNIMNDADISWLEHEESKAELAGMLATLNELIPIWQTHSHHESHDAFRKITDAQARLNALVHKSR
ncbi:MAG: hypothetical protein G01um10148_263 [Parcubacteria group bacterium Gr01-1014_8]|nr:MAG: hypothetical protein G01um10148_263 [Parcubacteria group bacterium Gr01-1014_8]